MASLEEDIEGGAAWIADPLSASGYRADFSPSSLWELDRFFDEHTERGQPRKGGLLADSTGSRLFALGSYLGDVVRRHGGGEWQADDDDPAGEVNVALALPTGGLIWPVQRAMKARRHLGGCWGRQRHRRYRR